MPLSSTSCTLFVLQGELMRNIRHAPRKESAFATVTAGMRVLFCEGSEIVQDMSIYFGGVGPTTAAAPKTCGAIVSKSELFPYFLFFLLPLFLKVHWVIFSLISNQDLLSTPAYR